MARAALAVMWRAVWMVLALACCGVAGHALRVQSTYQTGFNAVDLWWRYQANNVSSARATMAAAARQGIPFLRVAASGFWPKDMASYEASPAAYWAMFDRFVADAADAGLQLVLSIQWQMFLFADMNNEPLGRLFEDGSLSRYALLNYTASMVSRYAASGTVLMWELGNEYNLLADLDMAKQQPDVCVPCGTPAKRTRADNFSTPMLMDLQQAMVDAIRQHDATTLISSGCSIPRPSAWHLAQSYYAPARDWQPDTRAQFVQNLLDVNAACDTINVHFYNTSSTRWNVTNPLSTAVLKVVAQAAANAAKPLYIGEFGQAVPLLATGNSRRRPFNRAVLDFVQHHCVEYSSTWVFEYAPQANTYSITPSRDETYLALVNHTNGIMRTRCPLRTMSNVVL